MRRFIILALTILLSTSISIISWGDEVDVYLLGGQSNMVGSGQTAELPDDLQRPFDSVFFWNGNDFDVFHPGTTNFAAKGQRFGPEVGLIAELTKQKPVNRKIYVIKYAVGGMPLDHRFDRQKWTEQEPAPGRTNFYPGTGPDDPNQGKLFVNMLKQFQAGIAAIRAAGDQPNIRGFVWMQGEADTRRFAAATKYAWNFRRLVERMRAEMGDPKLPVVFGKVLPHVKKFKGKRQKAIREIHRKMSALDMGSSRAFATSRVRMVDTATFEMKSDNVHFTSQGQLSLGRAFANALNEASSTAVRFELWGDQVAGFPDDYEHQPPVIMDPEHITEVSKAYLEFFPARQPNPNKASVIVLPGGGYRVLADMKEGNRVAQYAADQGFNAFVLRYRVTRNSREPFMFPGPLYDARRAIAFVKSNAEQFGIDPAKVGILGFSAGGHLASMAGTRYEDDLSGELAFDFGKREDNRVDSENGATENDSTYDLRPAFTALIYPVGSMIAPESHGGSRQALFGEKPTEEELIAASPERRLTKTSPPLFIVHNEFDPCSSIPSLNLALAAQRASVPCELHLYPSAVHGFGMGGYEDTEMTEPAIIWPRLFIKFLRRQ